MTRERASYTVSQQAAMLPGLLIFEPVTTPTIFLTLGVGCATAYALHLAHNYLEDPYYPSIPAVERLHGRLRVLGLSDQILLHKIRRDFILSPLTCRQHVELAQRDMLRRLRVIGISPDFENEALGVATGVPSTFESLSDDLCKPYINRLMKRSEAIRILSLSLHPAMLATLIDIRDRIGLPLEINAEIPNGVLALEHLKNRFRDGKPYDVALLPSSVFALARQAGSKAGPLCEYSTMLPVYAQAQHLVGRKDKGQNPSTMGIERVVYLQNSSAEEQVRKLREIGIGRTESPYGAGTRFDVTRLDKNEAVILWAPLHEWALSYWNLASAGKYWYWLSLYALQASFKSPIDKQALVMTFLNSWSYCSRNLDYATGLVLNEPYARGRFKNGLRAQLGRA